MKIILISPRSIVYGNPFYFAYPNIGIGYIAAVLKEAGYEIEIIDLNFDKISNLIQSLKNNEVLFIGFSIFIIDVVFYDRLAKIIKRDHPDLPIIVGGPHPNSLPFDTLKDFDFYDFVVYGEGEITIVKLAEILKKSRLNEKSLNWRNLDYKNILGIVYREENGKIIKNPPAEDITDLSSIPFPAWELFNLDKYRQIAKKIDHDGLILPTLIQRGCPYQCSFCQNDYGKKVRKRSVENIIKELKRNISQFKITRFGVNDEIFTFSRKYVQDFCENIISEKLNYLRWAVHTRVNLVNKDTLKIMKQAGCYLISYGIESGNQEILNRVKKGISIKQIYKAIYYTKQFGIITFCYFMFGLPGETKKTMRQSLKFMLRLDPNYISPTILLPYPNTQIFNEGLEMRNNPKKQLKNGDLIISNYEWQNFDDRDLEKIYSIVGLPMKYIKLFRFYVLIRFYIRKGKIRDFFKLHLIKWILIPMLLSQINKLIKKLKIS